MRYLTRFRAALTLLGIALLPQPAAAQEASPIATREGDTITVIRHEVPAGSRQAYEDWMRRVWWVAAKQAGGKHPEFGRALSARRRFVTAGMEDPDVLTYVFIYPIEPPPLDTKRSGLAAALELAGMPEEGIEREMMAFEKLGVTVHGLRLVQREYR